MGGKVSKGGGRGKKRKRDTPPGEEGKMKRRAG